MGCRPGQAKGRLVAHWPWGGQEPQLCKDCLCLFLGGPGWLMPPQKDRVSPCQVPWEHPSAHTHLSSQHKAPTEADLQDTASPASLGA